MQTQSQGVLIPLILVWLISSLAAISFFWQAYHQKSAKPLKGWRKFLFGVRFRLTLISGFALIIWVVSGVIWVLTH
jgi:hypothetical protein